LGGGKKQEGNDALDSFWVNAERTEEEFPGAWFKGRKEGGGEENCGPTVRFKVRSSEIGGATQQRYVTTFRPQGRKTGNFRTMGKKSTQ